ncbi:hypothetical protein CDD82_2503 [Ophiocordyceps australis]|uniref:Transcription factor domain-containing protein n=1 Tax=Ophiocordyceps australis TaxID=1399860 RepID=A0A2C5XUD1_9HYPO|nr:hypothetical protein CDD82_2503 [Ophiocordyceps australis]
MGENKRCHRLNKDCTSRPPAPPRIKKRPKRSRVAELEKRLNELSSQFVEGRIAAAAGSGASPAGSAEAVRLVAACQPSPESSSSSSSSAAVAAGIVKVPEKTGEILNLEYLFPSPSSTSMDLGDAPAPWPASPESGIKSWASPWPLPSEGNVLLAQYHDVFAHLFPFVVVPKTLAVGDMHTSRPFLWKAVMLVSCIYDGARQARLGEELLAEIGKAAIADGIKSLDLLQSLQLLVAW